MAQGNLICVYIGTSMVGRMNAIRKPEVYLANERSQLVCRSPIACQDL